jgi:hypothetical protein
LAANINALPSDVKWTNIVEYNAEDLSSFVDRIAGELHNLQDNSQNGLVDKRASDITSLRGAPAALATPDS